MLRAEVPDSPVSITRCEFIASMSGSLAANNRVEKPVTVKEAFCRDNAMAESFFSALKKERIKRRIYPTRATATTDVLDYIEMFYNPILRHGLAGNLSPLEFERRYTLNGL